MKLFNTKSALAALLLAVTVTSCDMDDFGDINQSPNQPSTAYTSMLFTYSATFVRNFTMTSYEYDPWMQMRTGYIAESKNNQYGDLDTTVSFNTTNYYRHAIKNLNTIIEMNEDPEINSETNVVEFGDNANQIAAAKTLRAFYYMTMTDILGPIPYSEAFKGESDDIWAPKLDSQESIYAALDADLRQAYSQFNEAGSLTAADIFFGGDISKWKKFNATIREMMAIKMAEVAPTEGQSRFAQAYSDGAMETNDDSFSYTFDTKISTTPYAWFYYIGNLGYSGRGLGFAPNKIFVDALKEYKDPRTFTYLTIGSDAYLGARPGDPADFDSYIGIELGLENNDAVNVQRGVACSVASKYCEPTATYGLITAARTKLVEAEAATLGWINADANALYQEGISLSFEEQGAAGLDEYLASEKVVLSSDKETALKQIVMQRFLAGFLTDGIESWSDWRRYDIPSMPMGPQQLLSNHTVYPYRMEYYSDDYAVNEANIQSAVQQYLGGSDDRWSRVWWDVKDNVPQN